MSPNQRTQVLLAVQALGASGCFLVPQWLGWSMESSTSDYVQRAEAFLLPLVFSFALLSTTSVLGLSKAHKGRAHKTYAALVRVW